MKYILTAGWDDGIANLAQRLNTELAAGKRVLWLLSGGSNIQASVEAINLIPDELTKQLSLLLIDERYGEPGHSESNWAKLETAGFKTGQANVLAILQPRLGIPDTQQRYEQLVTQAFENTDISIAQLGIGDDGHVAGLMVGTPEPSDDALVMHISASPYERLTLTYAALRRIDIVLAFAFGDPKRAALEALQTQDLPLATQPAQILKQLKKVCLYNDQIGERT